MHIFPLDYAPLPSAVLLGMLAAAQVSGSLGIGVRVLPAVSRSAPVLHQVALGGAYLSWQTGQAPTISSATAAPSTRPPARPLALGFAPGTAEAAEQCRPLAIDLSAWQDSLRQQKADLCSVTIVPE
jgi:hypothetical protein